MVVGDRPECIKTNNNNIFGALKKYFWHSASAEEELVAKVLHVSVKDLEHAIDPLRRNQLLSPFPTVHVGNVEEMYGKSSAVVGRGTGGVVRLFRKQDGTMFAVKEFKKARISDNKRYATSLVREYAIASVLRHPNIVKTVDLIIDNEKIYEVMEYCLGDLFNFICRGGYGEPEINCCFKQILQGVEYLHSIGIAHRDLKPENICVDTHAKLKIIDFGLCSIFKSSQSSKPRKSHGVCGSAPYIAPEEWINESYDPQKVDVWSCGIIYLTLTFHGFPWETATTADPHYAAYVKALKRGITYSIFARLSEACQSVILQMLNPDPAKRPSITDVLQSEWMKAVEVCTDCLTTNTIHKHFT